MDFFLCVCVFVFLFVCLSFFLLFVCLFAFSLPMIEASSYLTTDTFSKDIYGQIFPIKKLFKKIISLNVFLQVSHSQVRLCTWLWVLLKPFCSVLFTCMSWAFRLLKVIVTPVGVTGDFPKGGSFLNFSKYEAVFQNNPREWCKTREK